MRQMKVKRNVLMRALDSDDDTSAMFSFTLFELGSCNVAPVFTRIASEIQKKKTSSGNLIYGGVVFFAASYGWSTVPGARELDSIVCILSNLLGLLIGNKEFWNELHSDGVTGDTSVHVHIHL